MSDRPLPPRDAIEEFVHHEAALLDERRLAEWVELFAEDGRYWVPGRRGGTDAEHELSIVYDDRRALASRLRWLTSGRALAQDPPSLTLHQITNLRMARDDTGLLELRCSNVVWETRPNTATVAVPSAARYLVRDESEPWRIVLKYVELLDYGAHYENLTFLL